MAALPSSCWVHKGIFSPILPRENLVAPLKVKFTKMWGSLKIGPPPGIFLNFQTGPHWATSAIHQLQFGSSSPGSVSYRGFCCSELWFCFHLPVSPTLGQQFVLWSQPSDGAKKSCWIFTLFSYFLSCVRWEWWFPMPDQETRSSDRFVILGFPFFFPPNTLSII